VALHQGGDVERLLDLEQAILVRLLPMIDPRQSLRLGGLDIGSDDQDVLVQFAEFGWIVAAEIDKEQFVLRLRRRFGGEDDVISVDLLDRAPAIEMEAFRLAPPLPRRSSRQSSTDCPIENRTSCNSTLELPQSPPM
jgi:hypothetical protein